MTIYTEVYRWRVADEVNKGVEVFVLDKEGNTTGNVNSLPYETVMKALDNNDNRFYFWKEEEVAEEPQATENEA